jgi:hypothetical protein
MAAMDVLPTELLMEIFVFCASSSEHALAPVILTRVCHFWRNVIIALPRAWQFLYLDDERRSLPHSRLQAQLWSSRSAPLSFDVKLNLHQSDMLLPLLSPLLPEIRRWRGFTMTGVRQESIQLPILCDSSQCYPLHQLHIEIEQPDEDDITEGLYRGTFKRTTCDTLCASALSMNVWVESLPQASLITPLRITTLHVSESLDPQTQAVHLLEFLTACVELESLHFTSWPRDTDINDRPPLVVSLPRLRCLHLASTCSARTILSHLHTPMLTELHLAHLNVNFPLHPTHNDPGDSEDEAQDFSQSPSSDQATGMGLRKLITRSNPPIEILEMDYSDMRTKDFRWCFDRLTALRCFRIVASDMSDKVVNLLRPYQTHQDRWDDLMRLRLPNLVFLELCNCQRLSGEALMDAIGSRVRYTDMMTPGPTLLQVSIIGCLTFEPWHAERLRQDLGPRLRV